MLYLIFESEKQGTNEKDKAKYDINNRIVLGSLRITFPQDRLQTSSACMFVCQTCSGIR